MNNNKEVPVSDSAAMIGSTAADVPERIFLQIGECEKWEEDLPIDWKEVTWCADKIFDNDIEYVRVHKRKKKK